MACQGCSYLKCPNWSLNLLLFSGFLSYLWFRVAVSLVPGSKQGWDTSGSLKTEGSSGVDLRRDLPAIEGIMVYLMHVGLQLSETALLKLLSLWSRRVQMAQHKLLGQILLLQHWSICWKLLRASDEILLSRAGLSASETPGTDLFADSHRCNWETNLPQCI